MEHTRTSRNPWGLVFLIYTKIPYSYEYSINLLETSHVHYHFARTGVGILSSRD